MFLADTKIRALISGDPAPFGVYYTFANVVGILGSFFMSGPTQQARKMTEGNRLVSTLVYVSALVATLFFVFFAGIPTQPRTLDPEHMRENLGVFDWELSEADMRRLSTMPQCNVTRGDPFMIGDPEDANRSIYVNMIGPTHHC